MSKPVSVNINGAKVNIPLSASTLVWNFADGTSQEFPLPEKPDVPQPTPVPVPVPPPAGKVVNIVPGSLDEIDFNATPDTKYIFACGEHYTTAKGHWINKPGVTLDASSATGELPVIDFVGNDRDAVFQVRGDNFTARNLICSGSVGTTFIKARGCKSFTADTITQVQNAANLKGIDVPYEFNGKKAVTKAAKGGITPLDIGGMTDALLNRIISARTTRYGIYISATLDDGTIKRNSGIRILGCNLGPSDTEHCLRCYHIDNTVIEDLVTDNRGSQYKQSVKLMSGANVIVRRWTDKGDSRRLGRDVNDKPAEQYILTATIEDSNFQRSTLFQIDPGATVMLRRSSVASVDKGYVFNIMGGGSLTLDGVTCTHTNAKATIANARSRVKLAAGGALLNGKAVK